MLDSNSSINKEQNYEPAYRGCCHVKIGSPPATHRALAPVRKAFLDVVDVHERLHAERDRVAGDKMLSEAGRANVLQTLAAKETAPAFARAQAAYATLKSELPRRVTSCDRELRIRIMWWVHCSAGSSAQRSETTRARCSRLSTIRTTDGRIIEALLEMPRALSGIPSDVLTG